MLKSVHRQVNTQIRGQIWNQAMIPVSAQIRGEVYDQVLIRVSSQARVGIRGVVRHEIS